MVNISSPEYAHAHHAKVKGSMLGHEMQQIADSMAADYEMQQENKRVMDELMEEVEHVPTVDDTIQNRLVVFNSTYKSKGLGATFQANSWYRLTGRTVAALRQEYAAAHGSELRPPFLDMTPKNQIMISAIESLFPQPRQF